MSTRGRSLQRKSVVYAQQQPHVLHADSTWISPLYIKIRKITGYAAYVEIQPTGQFPCGKTPQHGNEICKISSICLVL